MTEDNDLTDPEDAYDASDSPKQRLLNFARRINWLIDRPDGWYIERLERLRDDLDRLRSELDD